jgi:uroporphyrinogen-III synthase
VAVFAVGPQTEDEALRLGFRNVRSARGDSKALAAAATRWASPSGGALLHVKSMEGDGLLMALLKARGFAVQSAVLYEVAAVTKMPPALRAILNSRRVDAALFFSPRSAAVFRDGADGIDLAEVIAVCISEATAAALAPLAFREVRVAAEPNQFAVLACLE